MVVLLMAVIMMGLAVKSAAPEVSQVHGSGRMTTWLLSWRPGNDVMLYMRRAPHHWVWMLAASPPPPSL